MFRSWIVFMLFGVLTPPAFAATLLDCSVLSRNLKVGMSGEDVRVLQQLLNGDTMTRIARSGTSGAGSLGFETTYFGNKTKDAVVRFQNLYAQEVLSPAGLTVGSGFIGQYSRAKLVALCSKAATPAIPAVPKSVSGTSTVPAVPAIPEPGSIGVQNATPAADLGIATFTSPVPVLMYPSLYAAPRGTPITLYTVGLAPAGNTVHLGSYTIASTSVDVWGMLSFTIPLDAPRGIQQLFVSSTKGDTNTSFFIVTDSTVLAPQIHDFNPKEGPLGTVVTVTGEGFTPTRNEVVGGQSPQSGISSLDGTTIRFEVNATIPGLNFTSADLPLNTRIPVWYYLRNENGLTDPIIFTVTR